MLYLDIANIKELSKSAKALAMISKSKRGMHREEQMVTSALDILQVQH